MSTGYFVLVEETKQFFLSELIKKEKLKSRLEMGFADCIEAETLS